jgi:uncharacterized protein (DUF1330 family)
MTAYRLARGRVDDPEQYARYANRRPGILERYGNRVPARGGAHDVLEGSPEFTRWVVIAFPSLDAARDRFNSADYEATARCRHLPPRRPPVRRAPPASGTEPGRRQRLRRSPRRC